MRDWWPAAGARPSAGVVTARIQQSVCAASLLASGRPCMSGCRLLCSTLTHWVVVAFQVSGQAHAVLSLDVPSHRWACLAGPAGYAALSPRGLLLHGAATLSTHASQLSPHVSA